MKVSLNILKSLVKFKTLDIAKIEKDLTDKVSEIDEVIFQNKGLEKVFIGEIIEILPHPDADKMQITKTRVGDEILQIVCGAKNIKVGLKVPVAVSGAILPGGFEIKKADKRGVESNGMICSESELGLSEKSEGIMELSKEVSVSDNLVCETELEVGKLFFEEFGLDDVIFEVENTAITNRPDLFSHIGWAKELITIDLAEKIADFEIESPKNDSNDDFPLKIDFEKGLVKKMMAVKISGIENGESPEFIQEGLKSVGIRPISFIVDVTNYVMILEGVPIHAFDISKINGKNIKLRKSKNGEKITTLDGEERKMSENSIIMEDEKGIFDLCGIMGGANSEIEEKTSEIWLHVPVYDPILIRRASIGANHRTEASTIYEKNVPVSQVENAFNFAIALILENSENAKISSKTFEYLEENFEKRVLNLSKNKLNTYIGEEIGNKEVFKVFQGLGFGISDKKDFFEIEVPGFRAKDINLEEDLIEEFMRIFGLDKIKIKASQRKMEIPKTQKLFELEKKVKNILSEKSLNEAINFSFFGENLFEKLNIGKENLVEIINPLSEKLQFMRSFLFPYLLENAKLNSKNFEKFGIFEFGKVFEKVSNKKVEKNNLAFCLFNFEIFEGKKILEEIFEKLGISFEFKNSSSESFLHPGQSSEIILQGKKVGFFGTLHPQIAKNFDFTEKVLIFEMDFEFFETAKIKIKKFKKFSSFPESFRDICFLVGKDFEIGRSVEKVSKSEKEIKNISLIDVFEDEKILGEGKKELTFRCKFGSDEKTLEDEDVNNLFEKVKEKFEGFGFEVK